jgi:hypothetical protein
MCKKLIVLFLMLAFVGSASAVNYWGGAVDSNWFNSSNWLSSAIPTSADWTDFRSDNWQAGVGAQPVITAGQTAVTAQIRMNPGYGAAILPTITVSGGTLNAYKELYIGDAGGNAQFILNSGLVNIGYGGSNGWTFVGGNVGNGKLYINGGTFNAGILGVPKWYGGTTGTGHVYIDGGLLNTAGILIDDSVSANVIEFTKNLADGGGKIVDIQDINDALWTDWQAQVADWVSNGQISTSASAIQADFSSNGTIRTTEIYSVVPEPMSVALLGVGGLLLRRKRRK